MKPFFVVFLNICLLRRGPELVPTHPLFVSAVVIADMLVSIFSNLQSSQATSVDGATLIQAATAVIVFMATIAASTWMMLSMRDVIGRFPATITALFGCDVLFTLLSAALIPLAGDSDAIRRGIVDLIVIWSIAVYGFILHRAMNVTVLIGIGLAFGMAVLAGTLAFNAAAGS